MKKPQELHDELTKKLVTENYVDLKPINKIEASPKLNWEAKYLEFINEAGSPALNPIVNNDKKINTAEGDEKIKNVEGKYTMDTKEAGSFKISDQVENVASHNYDYSPSVDNINNVNAQELQNGIYCEVKADPKLTLEEAQELVIKNLAKDPLFYVKNGAFGVKGLGYEEQKISENDGETYGGSGYSDKIKDTDNAMQVVKESVKDVLKEHNLGGVATEGNPNSIAKQMGDYFTQMMEEHGLNDGQVVAEENKEDDMPMDEAKAEKDVEEARQQAIEASQEAAGMDIDEKKDHDGDGDIDSDDYLAARDKAIKANKAKKTKKENIETKLAEIGKEAEMVKMEAQLDFLHEYIDEKIARVNSINEDENLKELVDKKKMKDMQKEIKLLEKRKAKMEKVYEKHCGKSYKRKEVVDEMDAVSWNEKNNPTRGAAGERDPKKVGKSTSDYAVNK